LPARGTIDLPLSVGRKGRVRVAANRADIIFEAEQSRWSIAEGVTIADARVYPSLTTFARVWENEHTALVVKPITGRRHQIRVHLAWIGHPIVGDPLFERDAAAREGRMFLHSWRLKYTTEWSSSERTEVEAVPSEDFWAITGYDARQMYNRA